MRLVMMGTGAFAEPTFQALLDSPHEVVCLVTNPDRPSGRDQQMVRNIKQIAVARNVPVFQPESVNAPESVARLKELAADLLVVAAYGQILSDEVLATARHGGINVHASLLPKYRGAAPIAWAIYHGEKRTGVTIIRMATRVDAGEILAQAAVDIGPEETAGELEARLAPIGAQLALHVIEEIDQGTSHGVPQDQAGVTKAPKLKKEHGLIDWTRTAEQVCNQIRAMQPWPTAYTYWHPEGKAPVRIIVRRARPVEDIPAPSPGRAIRQDRDTLIVAAGSGGVQLLELQPAGKRAMSAAEFLRGYPVQSGDRFGAA